MVLEGKEFDKVIFLDHDGVLATDNEYDLPRKRIGNQSYYPFNSKCVDVLNEILMEVPNAVIIVSSDWKLYWTLDQMKEIYIQNGIIRMPVGYTIDSYKHFNTGMLQSNRASEITHCLIHNQLKKYDDIKANKYVVIDDLDMSDWFPRNFVLCGNPKKGIAQPGVKERILKILKHN
ncbi:MAG: HAD domain-containing protein [bacterium]